MRPEAERRAIIKKLWPNAPNAMIEAVVTKGRDIAIKYELNTPLRIAHFMAQISHESGGGTITVENMNYTTSKRICQVWPSRFPNEGSAQPYVKNPRGLANKVYNGRMGNRSGTDDGYNYRGHGLLQLTGREAYIEMGKLTGLNLVDDPDKASSPPENSLEIAACEFRKLKCLPAADADDVRLVTYRVNGGYNGLEDRKQWLAKWKKVILPKLDLTS